MNDPREFPCMDDCGNGYGNTIYDLQERFEERSEGEEEIDIEENYPRSTTIDNKNGAFAFTNTE